MSPVLAYGGSDSKASVYNVGDPGLIPGLGRSLVGYSPWGSKELDMTERLHFTSQWLWNEAE